MVSSYIVHSNGIFHGLPTYPKHPDAIGLTAIVTGSTGLSGYHMVKILAASPRWSKIYCLSSRPAQPSFFAGLGDGAEKVEHLQVDFLSEPSQIADILRSKIKQM
jgi:hypothetical protein